MVERLNTHNASLRVCSVVDRTPAISLRVCSVVDRTPAISLRVCGVVNWAPAISLRVAELVHFPLSKESLATLDRRWHVARGYKGSSFVADPSSCIYSFGAIGKYPQHAQHGGWQTCKTESETGLEGSSLVRHIDTEKARTKQQVLVPGSSHRMPCTLRMMPLPTMQELLAGSNSHSWFLVPALTAYRSSLAAGQQEYS